jgi:hypothetical protein
MTGFFVFPAGVALLFLLVLFSCFCSLVRELVFTVFLQGLIWPAAGFWVGCAGVCAALVFWLVLVDFRLQVWQWLVSVLLAGGVWKA